MVVGRHERREMEKCEREVRLGRGRRREEEERGIKNGERRVRNGKKCGTERKSKEKVVGIKTGKRVRRGINSERELGGQYTIVQQLGQTVYVKGIEE